MYNLLNVEYKCLSCLLIVFIINKPNMYLIFAKYVFVNFVMFVLFINNGILQYVIINPL